MMDENYEREKARFIVEFEAALPQEVQKTSQFCKEWIEKETGLTLTTIELFGLRRIVEQAFRQSCKDYVGGVDPDWRIAALEEASPRFYLEFYDLDTNTLDTRGGHARFIFDDATREWFKKEQQRRYLP